MFKISHYKNVNLSCKATNKESSSKILYPKITNFTFYSKIKTN